MVARAGSQNNSSNLSDGISSSLGGPLTSLTGASRESVATTGHTWGLAPPTGRREMGCSSGRQPPVLHTDLDCGDSSEANTLPQDAENQNQGSNDCGDKGGQSKRPETLATLERLTQATGGTEKSWYRCVFPFGVISLVIGMAGTGVTFTFNTLLQTKVVSVALLCAGIVMLLVAAVCWRAHRLRRRKKKEGGFFAADQATL
ncbi:uncharacterized protein AB9W97_002787 isoform 2-T2 [Spinachia spinachia]